uniref:Uncharacterized protein n=1 Tax=Oryza brachyantha TaxID=4533 RepID=J3MKW1_ORYBR
MPSRTLSRKCSPERSLSPTPSPPVTITIDVVHSFLLVGVIWMYISLYNARFKMTKLAPVFFIVHFLTNLQNILHLLRKIYELNVVGLERIMESFAKERLAFMKNSSNQNNRCVVLIIVIKQIITVCISMIYIVGLQWYRIALICKKVSGLLNLEEPSVKDQLKGGSFINYYMV